MSVPVLTRHDPGCDYARESDGGHSDASKRISDTHNLHLVAGESGRSFFGRNENIGRVFACRLSDGRSDGVLYDSLEDAVSHQKHNEDWYAYLRVTNGGMTVCQAASFLRLHRQSREAGHRMAGTSPRVPVERLTREAFLDQVRAYERRDWIRPGRR